MDFKVGDRFINTFNKCEGILIRIDEQGYTFRYDILDFFTECYNPVCIEIKTINRVELKMLLQDGIIKKID